MTLSSLSLTPAAANTQDVAAIHTIVESVAVLADQGNFESLERLFADEIRVDYTSLSGGEPEIKSPEALMTAWASLLPGFDRTRHAISNIAVEIDGRHAVATADVVADHYVEGLHWQVSGGYVYELVSNGGDWRIVAMTFNLRGEVGTRKVFEPATANALANLAPYLARQRTRAAVETMLVTLEEKDMETFASVWADDAVQDMPFSPPGHPKRVVGKQAILDMYAGWPANSGKADFTSELVFYPMQDPEIIFVEYKGSVDVVPTGRHYQQQYGGLFHVVDGKITLFREFYDPAPFAWAFGLEEQ